MTVATLRQFDIFAQLVATGSIAECARVLGVPAAEVLGEMERIEARLGFRLFTVSEGAVELTFAGRRTIEAMAVMALEEDGRGEGGGGQDPPQAAILLPEANEVSEPEPDTSEQDAPEPAVPATALDPPPAAAPAQSSIVLAADPAIFSHFQDALVAFEQGSPDADISLALGEIDAARVGEMLIGHEADIAYFYCIEAPDDVPSRYAWSERVSLFVAADHPLAARDSVDADDLAGLTCVELPDDSVSRRLTRDVLATGGLLPADGAERPGSLIDIREAVRGGACFFAAFGPTARDFGKAGGVARLAYAVGLPHVQVRQAVRPDKARDPIVMALSEFLFR